MCLGLWYNVNKHFLFELLILMPLHFEIAKKAHESPIVLVNMISHGALAILQWRHNGHDGISNHQPYTIVYSTVYSGADQRKHQGSASLAFQWPVNSPHKWPVTRQMFLFDDVIMKYFTLQRWKVEHV